jgi:uncharacterized membrane protein YgaE (UPF0421/DUF939 family)
MAHPGSGGSAGSGLGLAWMDVMELAGRLAQQHAQELVEVLRLPGDQASQARTKLQALAQALHHILNISTSSSNDEEEERGSDGAMAMEEEEGGEGRSCEEEEVSHEQLQSMPCEDCSHVER